MARDGFYRIGAHSPDCYSREFCVLDRERPYDFSRRKNGYRNGSRMFYRFVCNDIDCSAVLLVRWDVMGKFINRGPNGVPHDA